MKPEDIEAQARRELINEAFREAVEERKAKLRETKTWWQRLVPYTVTVTVKRRT